MHFLLRYIFEEHVPTHAAGIKLRPREMFRVRCVSKKWWPDMYVPVTESCSTPDILVNMYRFQFVLQTIT